MALAVGLGAGAGPSGGGLPMLAGAGVAGHLVFLALSALLTVILSDFALIPRLAGPALAQAVLARGQGGARVLPGASGAWGDAGGNAGAGVSGGHRG